MVTFRYKVHQHYENNFKYDIGTGGIQGSISPIVLWLQTKIYQFLTHSIDRRAGKGIALS